MLVPGHYEDGVWYPDDPDLRARLDRQHLLQPTVIRWRRIALASVGLLVTALMLGYLGAIIGLVLAIWGGR